MVSVGTKYKMKYKTKTPKAEMGLVSLIIASSLASSAGEYN